MSPKPKPTFNSRKYQGQLERELIIGGIVITLIIGGGLIALIWGLQTFLSALVVFALTLGVIGLVWLFLKLLEIASRE